MMRYLGKIMTVVALLATGLSPAIARMPFSAGGPIISPRNYPGAPKPVYDDNAKSPYAMNYAEEAVQNLGFRGGHLDVFSTKPAENSAYLPSFSGGHGSDGAMLKLQWHPGE
jgi:hypothetical protein